jgi:hypothetical protein
MFGRTQSGDWKPLDGRFNSAAFIRTLFSLTLLCIAGTRAMALDPNQPPGRNFDLSHWHLTLPDADATTIKPSSLVAGYTNAAWFYTGADGAMVFYCPVDGGTTENSKNPRSELRERIDPSSTSANWPIRGTHILEAQCRILQLPSSGQLWIGQIHGYVDAAPVLMLLRYNNGVIETQLRPSPTTPGTNYFVMTNAAVGDLISYRIQFTDGLLSVTVNGATQLIDVVKTNAAWADQTFYFKAGVYCQDNTGPSSEGGRVAFYSLNASHLPSPVAPSITAQPASVGTNEGATAQFRVVANGTPPLFFQWQKDGVEIPDATNSNLIIPNLSTNDIGNYRAVVTNQAGSVTSALATLSLVPAGFSSLLAAALDASNLVWTTTGSQSWFAQTDVSHDGEDAAQSAPIGHSQTTTLQTTVTGPGTVAFWWKVSSEPSNDRLLFYIGSTEKARISGEIDWQWKTFPVSSGSQVLKWTYSKNSSKTGGLDRAWLDQVLFIPNNVSTAPIIAAPPVGTNVEAGAQVVFNVGAVGSPTLRYQWQHNGTNLANNSSIGVSGATSATLTLANVQLARAGIYSVIVSNAIGAVTNSDAVLTVIPVLTLAEALDLPAAWATSISLGWTAQTNMTHDGTDAARSGAIADDKSTSMQTTVSGPGVLSFWWTVSCEPSNDRLRFYVNGSEQARISGEANWTQRVYNLPSGTQTLQWKYSKDKEISLGQDRAWVDQVEFAPNATPSPLAPRSLSRLVPLTISVSNDKVLLSWIATPDKTYQVLYIESLAKAEWTDLTTEISFNGATASLEDPVEKPQRFYQVIER